MSMQSLEKQVLSLSEKVDGFSEKLETVLLIEERQNTDRREAGKLEKKMDAMVDSINKLNTTMSEKNGVEKGATAMLKLFRILVGSLVFVGVLTVASTLVDLHTRLAVIESKEVKG